MIWKNSVKKRQLKSRNLSEKKTHPEQKYSVSFVLKVGTTTACKLRGINNFRTKRYIFFPYEQKNQNNNWNMRFPKQIAFIYESKWQLKLVLFPLPSLSHKLHFFGVTRGFTRLIMQTNYVNRDLKNSHANFWPEIEFKKAFLKS